MNDQKLFFKDLKLKRESQDLTLEEISDFTKIDIKFLVAIENGDFSCLPSVYMRLFLRSYCKYISADAEQALNDYEFHTIGTKTEAKTFALPSESDAEDVSINEKELNLPQVPTAKIITIAVTVVALALTFMLISSIDSGPGDKDNSSIEKDVGNIDQFDTLKSKKFSVLPNDDLLTNNDFKTDNLIQGTSDENLVLSAPYIFRVEALTKTKINITNKVSSNSIVTNKILKAGEVEIFPVEEKISYDFWSAEHIKCSLNDIDLTEYFGSNNRAVRGWFTASKQKLSYNLYRHQSI